MDTWGLTSTETIRLIRNGGGGGEGGGGGGWGGTRIARLRVPTCKDRSQIVSHRQNNNVTVSVGRDPASAKQLVCFANCCLNKAATKTTSEKNLLRTS